ncbi:hypothetical protein N9164_12155 [Draconibacterium sp.]|nr:hypothetical protein [Draconibacterium sp.]
MSKRIGITAILFLFLFVASAQKKLNYIEVDKKTYELFLEQKWDELIDFSTKARKQGIDFFYLQARTGIAYYNLKKYRTSSIWFLKAWENDQSFEWLQEYLYYSLVYGGRGAEAVKLAANFTPAMQQKINFANSKITRVALEGGYCFNPDFNQLKELDLGTTAQVGNNYGEAYFLKNYHFESFDLSHRLAPGFHINHNLTYIGISREENVDWDERFTFPINTSQFQYFVNPHFLIGNKLNVSPSLTALWGKSNYYLGSLRGNSIRDFTEVNYNFSDIIVSMSLWSDFGNFKPGAEINLANIYDETFMQLSAWITIYPFSNANFYLTPRVYFKGDNENSLGYNAFGISGGAQLGKVHFYGQYLTGEMKNFVEAAGYVISNFPGTSERKFSGSLYFPLGKKQQLVLRYINQDVTEKYRVYTSGNWSNSVDYNYIKHTLTVGISWNF